MLKEENIKKRKTTKEEIFSLKDGEMIPLIKDKYGRLFFNNYEHRERVTLLASILLNMNYKDLEGNIEFLPLETNQAKAIYSKAICDIVLDVKLPDNPIILIVELNHFSKDLDKLFKDRSLSGSVFYNRAKTNVLSKSNYYLNRIYGTQKITKNRYLAAKTVIAYNLSTFSINEDNKDDVFRFTMSDLEHKTELTDKTQFYNLDVANRSKEWYNGKYQDCDKKEKNLILLSELLVTDKLSIAKECIDKFELDIDEEIREILKGGLELMYSKDESELLDSDLVEDEDDYYNQSYLEMKQEILDYAKSETVAKEKEKGREEGLEEGLEKGREEGIEEGLEKGREENQKDVIVSSYKENIPVEIIAKICKTSLAKVNKIIKEYCL